MMVPIYNEIEAMRERGTQECFPIKNVGVWLKIVSANGLKHTLV